MQYQLLIFSEVEIYCMEGTPSECSCLYYQLISSEICCFFDVPRVSVPRLREFDNSV